MCDRDQEIQTRSLDECVKHYKIQGRADINKHDSMEDCLLTA